MRSPTLPRLGRLVIKSLVTLGLFLLASRGLCTTGGLLSNGGFESGSISPWNNLGTATHSTTANVHAGSYAAQIPGGGSGMDQSVQLLAGKTYALSFYVKTDDANYAGRAVIKDASGTWIASASLPVTTAYQRCEIDFRTGSGTSFTLEIWRDSGSGSTYVDDCNLSMIGEILDNPGLESGSLAPWTNLGTAAFVTNTAANVYCGQYAVEVDTPYGSGIAQTLALQAGRVYTFSFYAKTSDLQNYGRTAIQDSNGNYLAPPLNVQSATYQKYSSTFTVPTNTNVTLTIWKDAGSGTKSLFIDNLSLTSVEQLLDNGGFEAGNVYPWNNFGTLANATTTAAAVHSGQYGLKIDSGYASGVRYTPTLSSGKTYTLTFFGKADANNHARVDVWSPSRMLAPEQLITTTGFQQYTVDFTVRGETSVNIEIWKDAGTGSGSVYIDDVSLSEKPPADFGSQYPGNAALVSVKSFGAAGDGVTDDTASIQDAIYYNNGRDIFFPAGTYLISSTLAWKNASGAWMANVAFRGENQSTSIIRLKNSTFTSVSSPQAMIMTASNEDWGNGSGYEAFNNFISCLTLNTGQGNPGAIGIDFIGNNRSAIRNVTVQSGASDLSGVAGISMNRQYVGPCLLKNVTINGFSYGMDVSYEQYSITMEHIVLSGQKTAGIRNTKNILNIRDLTSTNTVPALCNTDPLGLVTLIGATLNGGVSSNKAIVNSGALYLRSITSSGYGAVLGTMASPVSFYTSSNPVTLSSPASARFTLPIQETITAFTESVGCWADVGVPATNGDDTAAIQAVMNSGARTIYFRNAEYNISSTITVPSSVRRIVGLNTRLRPVGNNFSNVSSPYFLLKFAGTVNDVSVERLTFGHGYDDVYIPGAVFVQNVSTKALALVDCEFDGNEHHIYENGGATPGSLFIEDVYVPYPQQQTPSGAAAWQFNSENVWARQFNDERWNLRIANNAGNLWILGIKTEQVGSIISTTGGGKTELLGGLLYSIGDPGSSSAFICTDSSEVLTYATSVYQGPDYTYEVSETNGTQQNTLTHSALNGLGLSRGSGVVVPLFIGVH